MSNIKPLYDRVVIKRMEEEKLSAGGIVIPDSATEKPIKGEVIAVGGGKVLDLSLIHISAENSGANTGSVDGPFATIPESAMAFAGSAVVAGPGAPIGVIVPAGNETASRRVIGG